MPRELLKSRIHLLVMRLFFGCICLSGTMSAVAAQDCFGGDLTVNPAGVDFGQVSPGQLGLSSDDLSLPASPSSFTVINSPGELETTLDGSAYSGLVAMLTPELISTNDSDWNCIMINPVRNNLVVRYQLTAASGQTGGLSIGGQFVPVNLETDITIDRVFFFFFRVSGRIRAFPDLSGLTRAGSVNGTIQIEVFEQ